LGRLWWFDGANARQNRLVACLKEVMCDTIGLLAMVFSPFWLERGVVHHHSSCEERTWRVLGERNQLQSWLRFWAITVRRLTVFFNKT
jgi:hypothetical protein